MQRDRRKSAWMFESVRALIIVATCVIGCDTPEVEFLETKAIDERLTESDLEALLGVIDAVGEAGRSPLPTAFLTPPVWAESRTLPISELVSAEREALAQAWIPEAVAERLPKGDPWDTALKSHRLTRAQFCALALSATAAAGRLSTDTSVSLERLSRRGEREIASLESDERPFSSLTSDDCHAIMNQSLWLPISDRASRLATVPVENTELVAAYAEKLRMALGDGLFTDPFAGLYPRPADFGIPFEEGDLSDATLTWSINDAIIGDDAQVEVQPP